MKCLNKSMPSFILALCCIILILCDSGAVTAAGKSKKLEGTSFEMNDANGFIVSETSKSKQLCYGKRALGEVYLQGSIDEKSSFGDCTVYSTTSELSISYHYDGKTLQSDNKDEWNLFESDSKFIGKHQVHMNNHPEIERILAPKSIEEAARLASSELNMLDEDVLKLTEAIRQLPADDNPNFILLDAQGKPITKAQLLQNKGDGIIKPSDVCDDRILEQFKKFNVDHIKVQGGVADLKPLAIDSFPFTDDMVRDMTEYHKILANKWSENPSSIPPEIKQYLTDSQIQNLDDTMVQQALSNAKITLHEGTDKTVYLVDTYVHSKFSHFGGVAAKTTKLLNQIKGSRAIKSSIDFIKQVITFSSTEIRGTYVSKEAV